MTAPATHAQFTPAASADYSANMMPQVVTLPPADPANMAALLHNHGPGELHVIPGRAGDLINPVSTRYGAIRLMEGQAHLLPVGSGFDVATEATVQGRGHLAFSRGSIAATWLFPADPAAVV